MSRVGKEVQLARRPVGSPVEEDFAIVEREIDSPQDGRFVVRNEYLSLDPYLRLSMSDARSHHGLFALDRAVPAMSVGTVIESRHPGFAEGSTVSGPLGWREYAASSGTGVRAVDVGDRRPSLALGALGMTGFTAWIGMTLVGRPTPDDTVYVSAAGGAVGTVAGQLAARAGATVIGSAGSDDKVAHLVERGFSSAFNYRTTPVRAALDSAASRVSLFFDNVGGSQLEDAIFAMADRGRIVSCGAISIYNDDRAQSGPRNLDLLSQKGLSILGFRYTDFEQERSRFEAEMLGMLEASEIVVDEHIVDGIENTARAFISAFESTEIGKPLVRLSGARG